jgi:gamma-glutamyltranspeptidase/glutathione hydrolase
MNHGVGHPYGGAVTASSQEAADAGAGVLRAGGNAVDAAVAAALATCVADPGNTGIAGYGGYMLVQRPGERARCLMFPLCAPSNRMPQALARAYPESGPACSSVPNVIGGLARGLREFGTWSWAALSKPAIALAREGVAANPPTRRALELHRDSPFVDECFAFDALRSDAIFFRQPALAATLESMAAEGPEWFYRGPLADIAHAAWTSAGVDMPLADWREQDRTVHVVEAPLLETHGVSIQAAPLGFSGSACLFAFVEAAARIEDAGALRSAEGMARLAQAMASTWQYRFSVAGKNDFDGVDLGAWIDAALAWRKPAPVPADVGHTAHLNAIDAAGTVVALTFTHGPSQFGGRWALPGTGVIMNGGMHNFTRPAVIEHDGRWFGISNMTPAIAVDRDGARIAIGCPGARRIPSNIAVALARHLFAGQGLGEAVAGGRLHAEDGTLVFGEEDRLEPGAVDALRSRFLRFEAENGENYYGPLTAIRQDAGGIEIALDDRRYRGFGARA